jgi:hypothetical protein
MNVLFQAQQVITYQLIGVLSKVLQVKTNSQRKLFLDFFQAEEQRRQEETEIQSRRTNAEKATEEALNQAKESADSKRQGEIFQKIEDYRHYRHKKISRIVLGVICSVILAFPGALFGGNNWRTAIAWAVGAIIGAIVGFLPFFFMVFFLTRNPNITRTKRSTMR